MTTAERMSRQRSRDTKPEMLVRRALREIGLTGYRVHRAVAAGGVRARPDVVFVGRRIAVFVDGCFWHGCALHGSNPKTNPGFWQAKFDRNRVRDARVDRALSADGWRVVRVYEHEHPRAVAGLVAGIA